MTVCRVHDDRVHASVQQRFRALEAVRAHAGCRSNLQPALSVLGGVGVVLGFLDVLDGDQADTAVIGVDHQQLFNPELVQQLFSFVALTAFLNRDQVLVCHQLSHRLGLVLGKSNVAVGQDADQPFRARLHHWNAADLVILHKQQGVGEGRCRSDGHRVNDHAGLVLLHRGNGRCLFLDAKVLVDHANAACLCHGDCHGGFGDRIHSRRHQGNTHVDAARDTRVCDGVQGDDLGALGLEQHVVEGQSVTNSHEKRSLPFSLLEYANAQRLETHKTANRGLSFAYDSSSSTAGVSGRPR